MIDTLQAEKQALRRAAELLGGQAALAAACEYSDRRHVWPWFNTGRRVPAEKCPLIERATRRAAVALGDPTQAVTCEQLRPDVPWDVLREQASPTAEAAEARDAA